MSIGTSGDFLALNDGEGSTSEIERHQLIGEVQSWPKACRLN